MIPSAPANAAAAAWTGMSRGAKIAAGLGLVAILAILSTLLPLVGALLGPRPVKPTVSTDPQRHVEQQNAAFDKYLAQFAGRSLFIVPTAPKPPEPVKEASDEPSKPPPPPSTYGGPSMVAMLSDIVWFTNGKKMKVGEKADDLEVVALNPPWEATLKWKDVEFKVNFFSRNSLAKVPGEAASDKPAETKEEPKPAEDVKAAGSPDPTAPKPPTPPPDGGAPKPSPDPGTPKPPGEGTPPATPPQTPPANPQNPPPAPPPEPAPRR
ncbi:MAG: hypothetical protein JSR77_03065 [Planctomycetes bacterium]|nr:hypothetical protein [Planctomycetota bacterium]